MLTAAAPDRIRAGVPPALTSRTGLLLGLRVSVAVLSYLALKIFWPGGHDADFDGSNVLTALLDLAALALG